MRISDWSSDVCSSDLIKGESLKGDETRRLGPYREDDERREISGYYQSVNRNKKSIALDLKTPDGRDVLMKLIDRADVVVENYRAGVMERLGMSYETLSARNPKLIYAAIRGFGDPRSGESPYCNWPAFDIVGQRSEEHTSELQYLMSISYDVFCLKKK